MKKTVRPFNKLTRIDSSDWTDAECNLVKKVMAKQDHIRAPGSFLKYVPDSSVIRAMFVDGRLDCISLTGLRGEGGAFEYVYFDHCSFYNVDFSKINLTNCVFYGCTFSECIFAVGQTMYNSLMSGCRFDDSIIKGFARGDNVDEEALIIKMASLGFTNMGSNSRTILAFKCRVLKSKWVKKVETVNFYTCGCFNLNTKKKLMAYIKDGEELKEITKTRRLAVRLLEQALR